MKNLGDISRSKIDVHHHFWKYDPVQYEWISDQMSLLRSDYLPVDFEKARDGTGYKGSVAVQARQSVEETEWLLGLAEEHNSIRGVVGWLDLCAANIEEQINNYASNPCLKGLRHVLQDEPDDAFMLRPEFLNGISCLEQAGLLYDILISPRQLSNAIRLASLFPSQRFVLDHCAKPNIRQGEIQSWAEKITQLASMPNVSCKVSGLVTEADWNLWQPEDIYPYLDVIWNAFGEDRIMMGSDWPVCLLAASYTEVMDLPERYFEGFGSTVLDKLFVDNAMRIYQLQGIE
jgi:L-fuconolactonase